MPTPPRTPATIMAPYRMAMRISQSIAKAQKRADNPAGRISSRMPSGVSAETTESSTSGDDDDRIRDLVVHALAGVAEDQQRIDPLVERDDSQQPVHHVAQPEDAGERCGAAILAHDLDAQPLLGDGLA